MFKIDLHVHTVLGGDADILPDAVVAQARRVGLDGVCITEHHSYDLSRPFERIAAQTGFPIFRGFEYRAAEGHLLIYGVRAGRGDFLPGLPMQQVVEWIQGRGGVAVAAHPYQNPMIGAPLGDRVLQLSGLAAIETLNGSVGPEENRLAQAAAAKMGLPGVGGSDAHGLQTLGKAFTLFDEPITSEAHLVQKLREGCFRPGMAGDTLDTARGVHSLHH
ncbi:PHP domain-containing protein [Desulfatitalea alkaliphila]|uniref:PHP domain-containing protein n=1 Tax=Desulfatitalea alkaliphila TaxID=2929485 RepID=A0AA41R3P1_9BACT|nr:PHP domain-containing protein [Desulfatitalea alkaliphila]